MNRWFRATARLPAFFYVRTGMRPWRFGYIRYREKLIRSYIDLGAFSADRLPNSYGYRVDERIIEYPWLFSRLGEADRVILDAGSVLNHKWLIRSRALKNRRLFISNLAPERHIFVRDGVSYVFEDLRHSCFRDDLFDAIVSLSVIEHIGMDNTLLYTKDPSKNEKCADDYLVAVKEYRRMVRPGGRVFLSVPFGRGTNHVWYQDFDEGMIESLIETFEPAEHGRWYFKYHPDGWRLSSAGDCAEVQSFDVHNSAGYDDDFAAAARAVCCIELVKPGTG